MDENGTMEPDLSGLDLDELHRILANSANNLSPGFKMSAISVEETAISLESVSMDFLPSTRLWSAFKQEFRILLCTKDKKYASVRKSLSTSSNTTQMTIVSTISAAVASSLGVLAGSVIPLCAICLIALLKMGKEAFCRTENLDVKIEPKRA